MTSKPTARERFEEIKNTPFGSTEDAVNEITFLLSLVEAAVAVADIKENEVLVWAEIDQRMAEGEGK